MNFVLDNSVCMRWCFGDGKRGDINNSIDIGRYLIAVQLELRMP